MPEFVLLVGVLISGVSAYLLFKPVTLGTALERVFNSWWLYGVALLRLLLGAGLIASAQSVALPGVVLACGWLFAFAGLALVAIPAPPLRRMAGWFGGLSMLVTRLWLCLALGFGLFFIAVYMA